MRILRWLYPVSEGWHRVCVFAATAWLAYFAYAAISLQLKIWNDPWLEDFDSVSQIWRYVWTGIAGPFLVAAAARIARWIYRGFKK